MLKTMLLLLISFINIFLLDHSVGSDIGFTCLEKESIYLMHPSPGPGAGKDAHFALNQKLLDICKDFYDIEPLNVEETGVSYTIDMINQKNNIINLWAYDYYTYRTEKKEEEDDYDKIVYAGDIPDDHGPDRKAKVVSMSVAHIDSGDLKEFVDSIQYNGINNVTSRKSCVRQATEITDLKTVLICLGEQDICFQPTKPYSKELTFKFVLTEECAKYLEIFQNNLIAVLAPKPFDTDYEILIPTIFYEAPYMNSEYETQFPNSMNLISGLLLKYAFMKFINDAHWRRVAIISDDSPYSTDFEREMLEMFHEKQIMYNVQRCGISCNFDKAIQNLRSMDARIVIANVNEANARKLSEIIKSHPINTFTILFRVSPFWNLDIKNWYSITLGAADLDNDDCRVGIRSPSCAGIAQGLSVVAKAHLSHKTPETLNRKKFFRAFTNTMKQKTFPRSIAYVMGADNKLISTIYLNNDGFITQFNSHRHPFDKPILDQKKCSAKMNNFAKPCDYSLYMYIMFVLMMFAIMLLIITCYFHETSPLMARRYNQL